MKIPLWFALPYSWGLGRFARIAFWVNVSAVKLELVTTTELLVHDRLLVVLSADDAVAGWFFDGFLFVWLLPHFAPSYEMYLI